MKLVIVESPTKAKTISRFLSRDFKVESSYGHVRDLPGYTLGVDVEHEFEPKYVIPKKSRETLQNLKSAYEKADEVILATDEDREGEAIAWHLVQALENTKKKKKLSQAKPVERIVFHEITKKAVEQALAHPRSIDMDLVNAQQARRVLDRLVGYKLSPFLWKKIIRGLSAGRVQSVALRLIVEREQLIKAFVPEAYWQIAVTLRIKEDAGTAPQTFISYISSINGKAIEKPGIKNEQAMRDMLADLTDAEWRVSSVDKKTIRRLPKPPFTTSTLQQEAWGRLKFSAKKTMLIAQQLYEGIAVKNEGETGLITYMRTDSVTVSEDALATAGTYIGAAYGKEYALETPRRFAAKTKRTQEAHEAIRPTDPARTPDAIKKDLTRDQYTLYDLMWRRFIASQMQPALFDTATVVSAADTSRNAYQCKASGQTMRFDGYTKVYQTKMEERTLPMLRTGDALIAENVAPEEHTTQPPPRYTEATLIKALEQFGIGRPSTYAPIMSTIQDRGYVSKNETKSLVPTEIGEKVNDILVEHFPRIVDVDFTARMEEELDDIAAGKKEWRITIREFYGPFEKNLKEKYDTVEKQDMTEPTTETCERCGKPLVIRYGRFGRFLACSGFPECTFTKPLPPPSLDMKCPLCGTGDVVVRKTRKGRVFYGCSRFPECAFATWQKPTGQLCPECSQPLIELKNKIKCSNKSCQYVVGGIPKTSR